jgi:UDP-N-acetylglucosamine 2-epimerase (non-hydrolysing)
MGVNNIFMMNIHIIAGARPNFIKIASIINAIQRENELRKTISFKLIHTGQHYDKKMSEDFFNQLSIPKPDFSLGAVTGSHAKQTASIMIGYEEILEKEKPDYCLVVGDVNSTMACAITAQKMGIKVVHVEAGIRSNDWSMPEEINRLITDSITNLFFTTSVNATENLLASGVDQKKIFFVGNTMIDTLIKNKGSFREPSFWKEFKLEKNKYLVITLHRPSNVDDISQLKFLIDLLIFASRDIKLIFPSHPRTAEQLKKLGKLPDRLLIMEPMSYFEFNYIVQHSKGVITDSGGITEETTFMNVPCMTLRENTERPETVELGTNLLLGSDPKLIQNALNDLFEGNWKQTQIPELWDGKAGDRIIEILLNLNQNVAT